MFARNLLQCAIVLLNQSVFVGARIHHVKAGNDHERILTTDGACAEVVFRSAFVVGSTPLSDALETEGVIAAIQHTKLLTSRQNRLQTNLTIFIVFLDVGLLFGT